MSSMSISGRAVSKRRHRDSIRALLAKIPILTYHKIVNRREVGINALPPEHFQAQLACLQELGYTTITFHDLLDSPELPEKAVILTFDDGYASVYEHALPLMQPYGFRGVVYAVGRFIGRWNDWDANLGGIRFRHMDRRQLRELADAGWEVGAHSLTHRALSWLDETSLHREIFGSRDLLADVAGRMPASFAYPFGMHHLRVREMVKAAGFAFACGGINSAAEAVDPLQLRRVPVYQFEGLSAYRKKLRIAGLPRLEYLKLRILSWPAVLTPLYQKRFRRELFLEMEGMPGVYSNNSND